MVKGPLRRLRETRRECNGEAPTRPTRRADLQPISSQGLPAPMEAANSRSASLNRMDAAAWARGHSPIPVKPRKAGCELGPSMTVGCAGAANGAGIRFPMAGTRGIGAPRRIVGSRTKPPRPPPMPPRAKLGVAAATQPNVKITAKRRRMIALILLLCPRHARDLFIPTAAIFRRCSG
jgi:hypothetical protein